MQCFWFEKTSYQQHEDVFSHNIFNFWPIAVRTFHDGCKQGIDQQIFNRKSISRKITHPQSW